jgi:gliding motility-associated-like protein
MQLNKFYTFLFFTTILIFFSNNSYSQYIQTQQTAEDLINSVLAGGGVQISNVQLFGDSAQVGEFDNGSSVNLSINRGVVMTTGSIPGQLVDDGFSGTINSPANFATLSTSFNNTVDAGDDVDLNTIISSFGATANTNNKAVIEFDFIPSGDSLRFNYIFGSEEYNGFVCSQFFDVFGFFLSGPGINGIYTNNAVNIALVPGTNLPVSMNTINDGIGNGGGLCPPGGLDHTNLFIDNQNAQNFGVYGFTRTLTAEASVICGETYHIKLVIANGVDNGFDSWVWLEAASFNSSVPNFSATNLLPDSSTVEGCTVGTLTFTRSTNDVPLDLFINYGGTATSGVDYVSLPDTVSFAVGQSSVVVPFIALEDNFVEPIETVIISYVYINQCGDTSSISQTIKIRDKYALTINTPDLIFNCPQSNLTIQAQVSGGFPPFSYLWENNNQITPTINVPVGETTTFFVQISDSLDCTFAQYTDSVVVTILYDTLTTTTVDTLICPETSIELIATAGSGSPPYSFNWPNQNITGPSLTVTPADTATYIFTVTDACNVTVSDSFNVFVPEADTLKITTNDTTICKNGVAQLYGKASGGFTPYTYVWSGNPVIIVVNDSISSVKPQTTTTYFINLKDKCNTILNDSLVVTVQNCELNPGNAFSPNGDGLNDFFSVDFIEFYPNNVVYIFNRWGTKVFEKSAYNNDWNGDNLPSGTYFYVIDPGDGSELLKGYVVLFQK